MKKQINQKVWKRILAVILAACMLSGCGLTELFQKDDDSELFFTEEEEEKEGAEEIAGDSSARTEIVRPTILNMIDETEIEMAAPAAAPYQIASDLSNVEKLFFPSLI